jgi:hypothetical protein
MFIPGETVRLATLWNLAFDDARLACVIYRANGGLELKIESADAVMVTEAFDLQPRALARARALGNALKRRGWRDAES